MRISVHGGWSVRAVGGDIPAHIAGVEVPATVPGCIHLGLMAADLIPDPYLDEIDLVALGLDTHATVSLNRTVLGRTANMHRTHRLAAAGFLREGANMLTVSTTCGR